jgi:hypothetical protein
MSGLARYLAKTAAWKFVGCAVCGTLGLGSFTPWPIAEEPQPQVLREIRHIILRPIELSRRQTGNRSPLATDHELDQWEFRESELRQQIESCASKNDRRRLHRLYYHHVTGYPQPRESSVSYNHHPHDTGDIILPALPPALDEATQLRRKSYHDRRR